MDGDYWHKHSTRGQESLTSIIKRAGTEIYRRIPTNAVTFLSRKTAGVEEELEKLRYFSKPLPDWDAFERYAGHEEKGLAITGQLICDDHCIPADHWLIMDGMFSEILYGKPDLLRERCLLFTLMGRYEQLTLKPHSGREWITKHPQETRETLRLARKLYDFEKRVFLSRRENLELNMEESLALPEDWYRELEEMVVADARR
jgi:hypothetical protein